MAASYGTSSKSTLTTIRWSRANSTIMEWPSTTPSNMKFKLRVIQKRLFSNYRRTLILSDIFRSKKLRMTEYHSTVMKTIKVYRVKILMSWRTSSFRLMLNWLKKEEQAVAMTIFVRSHPRTDEWSTLFN